MSCPRCGELCRCAPTAGETANRSRPQPRFQPESGAPASPPAVEAVTGIAGDRTGRVPHARFVVEAESAGSAQSLTRAQEAEASEAASRPAENRIQLVEPEDASAPQTQSELLAVSDDQAWREELAARVHRYRTRRRPRGPRYPSLRLKFDAVPPNDAAGPLASPQTSILSPARAADPAPASASHSAQPAPVEPSAAEIPANIIPFPRAAYVPSFRLDELADPVLDRPRILEVPEVVPPPPALGGILIEPAQEPEEERRPGIDIPLQSAPLGRRLLAAFLDSLLVLGACALAGYIFFRLTAFTPPFPQAVLMSAAAAGVLWGAYQYLLLVYAGITPGLWLARLRLTRFDGSPATRRLRRWRVLASLLSGLSLGLGYGWCFLDEDALCWHDRITRTYLAPRK